MPISFRRSVFAGPGLLLPAFLLYLLSFPASQAVGQDTTAPAVVTPFMKQFNRFDLAVTAAGSARVTVSAAR